MKTTAIYFFEIHLVSLSPEEIEEENASWGTQRFSFPILSNFLRSIASLYREILFQIKCGSQLSEYKNKRLLASLQSNLQVVIVPVMMLSVNNFYRGLYFQNILVHKLEWGNYVSCGLKNGADIWTDQESWWKQHVWLGYAPVYLAFLFHFLFIELHIAFTLRILFGALENPTIKSDWLRKQ